VVYRTYIGSKSAVPQIILFFIIARLVCYGPIILSFRNFRSLILRAGLFILICVNFFIANIMRFYQRGLLEGHNVADRFLMIKDSYVNILHGVSSRLGFFDYYVESSVNSLYLPYISFKYYAMSIIDKLSPGFDVFNVVYASRMFRYARSGAMPKEGMHSDQVTIFGEASVIFSFLSIVWFFIMIIGFIFLIRITPSRNPFMNIFYSATIFYVYWEWIYGFGFDMFFCSALIYGIIFFFCILWSCRFTFHKRKSKTILPF
jgi:hypothetical protein